MFRKKRFILLMTVALLIVFAFILLSKKDSNEHFAIYLIKEEYVGKSDYNKINKLELEKEPFITDKDIDKYYWNEAIVKNESGSSSRVPPHTFTLIDETLYSRLEKINFEYKNFIPFVVVANHRRIYLGVFLRQSIRMSMVRNIPEGISTRVVYVIEDPIINKSTIVLIDKDNKDFRYDKRIKSALIKSGKLVE